MDNYIDVYDFTQKNPPFNCYSNNQMAFDCYQEISSVSVDEYLKDDDESQPGRGWNSRNTKINKAVIDWLKRNIAEGDWFLNMCDREIDFKNADDSWRFLEWLEEYELVNETLSI